MVNEIALKDAFSKIKDEFSHIKSEIQRLNNIISEITDMSNNTEEYRKSVRQGITEKDNIEKFKENNKTKEIIIEQHNKHKDSTGIEIKTNEIIDADSYY